jgi:hypothetical protein
MTSEKLTATEFAATEFAVSLTEKGLADIYFAVRRTVNIISVSQTV